MNRFYNYEALVRAIQNDPELYPMGTEPAVGRVLRDLIVMTEARAILELGTNKGLTTVRLCEAAALTNGTVTTIDIEDVRCHWLRMLDGQYTFSLGDSIKETRKLTHCDFAFIDSNHEFEQTRGEIQAVLDIMRPGGLVCCHDPLVCPGVEQAVKEAMGSGLVNGIILPTPVKPKVEGRCGLALLTTR